METKKEIKFFTMASLFTAQSGIVSCKSVVERKEQ